MSEEEKKSSSTLEKLVPVLLVLSIGLAFAVGMLWQKVTSIEKGDPQVAGVGEQPTGAQPQGPIEGKLTEDQAKNVPPVTDKDHIRGSLDAKVYLIEYSDFECPFCKRFHETAKQVVDEYQDQVAWVYRHYPLDMLHSQARTEAYAAECAFEQGGDNAFWAMADLIYEETPSNDGLDLAKLPDYAVQIGLDGDVLQSCVDEERFKDFVEEQYQGGVTAGVTGTPGSFIVTQSGEAWLIPGAVPFETIKEVIDEALQS